MIFNNKYTLTAFIALATVATTTHAFGIVAQKAFTVSKGPSSSSIIASSGSSSSSTVLFAESKEEDAAEKVTAELTDDEPKTSEDDEEEEESEEEGPTEDPEVTALKEEISKLETQLKQKNRDLSNLENLADEYTKNGYAREVAKMENFRNMKKKASTNDLDAAKATVLESFLPTLDKLKEVDASYEGNDFAKSYKALSWNFENALNDLGAVEYTVSEGDSASTGGRVNAVKEEYSETVAKGCVISPVAVGYELKGNVMRMADAVVSLGKEEAETEEEGEGEEEKEESGDEETVAEE